MGPVNGCRILVVEDDPMLALNVEQLLEDAGCAVVGPCATVARALEMARRGGMDAAILDVNLRGELVFPVADRLAEAGIPFVVVSGHSRDLLPPRHRGCRYLSKPFADADLLACLRVLLDEVQQVPPARGLA
jgi:chemotaxis family two-component system sensor kinase Cph1